MDKNHPGLVHSPQPPGSSGLLLALAHGSVTRQGSKAMKAFLIHNKFKPDTPLEGEGNCTPPCSIPDLLSLAPDSEQPTGFALCLSRPCTEPLWPSSWVSCRCRFPRAEFQHSPVAAAQAAQERAGLGAHTRATNILS